MIHRFCRVNNLVMKKAGLATICFLVVAASGVGAVTAWRQQNPIIETSETRDQTVDESVDTGDTIGDTTDPDQVASPDDAQLPDESAETDSKPRLSAEEYARLRDFPHRPFELEDAVLAGSDFAKFRQEFKQAIATRNAEFVLPLLPRYGDAGDVSIGFGMTPEDDLDLDQQQSWFWSTLEKAMEFGCVDVPDADLGYETIDGVVWVCPGTTLAFESQYPAPPDAEGVEHYFNNVMILGENVNLRSQPSLDGEVIALLSNEVVGSYSEGWDQVQSQLSEDQRRDPISGWTPIEIANGKRGFVASRYAYSPLEPRLVFGRPDDGGWTILHIPAGD